MSHFIIVWGFLGEGSSIICIVLCGIHCLDHAGCQGCCCDTNDSQDSSPFSLRKFGGLLIGRVDRRRGWVGRNGSFQLMNHVSPKHSLDWVNVDHWLEVGVGIFTGLTEPPDCSDESTLYRFLCPRNFLTPS